ncbi:MAG TPA: DUF5060 domain-containing protein [Candidatus Sulfotelmatobacter sp.]|nr:DUF5060 domain-containing protein [Candidatus Sulfotelmatobacter sp.]
MNLRLSRIGKWAALARLIFPGILGVLFASESHGQTTNYIVDQFDTDTAGLYTDQNWGTAVPSVTWSTNNALSTVGPNNPGSGSAFWQIRWPTTNDQIEVTRAFNDGAVVNLTNFSNVSFDIMFSSNSATDGNGSYGALEFDCVPQGVGWPSTALAIYTAEASNGNGWIHVTLPVNANLAITGIGLKIQQNRTGSNLIGTTAFWIDNIIFSGFTTPTVTGPPQILQLNTAQLWQRLEFQITNVPAASNPFDPDVIRLDGTFTSPSGKTISVPAFWYQGYVRSFSGGTEYDIVDEPPQWRLRFEPRQIGTYALSLVIQTNNELYATLTTNFTVVSNSASGRFGDVGIAPNNQYFQTCDGNALPLNGENVAWWDSGTYDYDTWFGSMQNAGENFARVWMSPWCFGIEGNPGTLSNYALDPAWQLDYVLQLAEQEGIYIQLTLDDYREYSSASGSDGQWTNNPYNIINGGPCVNQNAFFTNSTATVLYDKRLRYLIGRYGYSSHLLAWEFFNEIDHDYSYLNSNSVDAWIASQAGWLHTNDPYRHLVTTSLSFASADPQQWAISQLDFLSWHTYFSPGYQLNPAQTMAGDASYYRQTYKKVVQIGEYGTDWESWAASMAVDPYLRGLRQGIWGGALGGSAGTAMTWWWDSLAPANDYWLFSSLAAILGPTDWGRATWTNIVFQSGQQMTAIGMSGAHDSLVYVVASDAAWPNGATNATLPEQQGQTVTLTDWPAGTYYAQWYDPSSATPLGLSQGTATNGNLVLPLPGFSVDLAGVIFPAPRLVLPAISQNGTLQFQLTSEVGGVYTIEQSDDLSTWTPLVQVTNQTGVMEINPIPLTNSALFFRAEQN